MEILIIYNDEISLSTFCSFSWGISRSNQLRDFNKFVTPFCPCQPLSLSPVVSWHPLYTPVTCIPTLDNEHSHSKLYWLGLCWDLTEAWNKTSKLIPSIIHKMHYSGTHKIIWTICPDRESFIDVNSIRSKQILGLPICMICMPVLESKI